MLALQFVFFKIIMRVILRGGNSLEKSLKSEQQLSQSSATYHNEIQQGERP